VRRHVLWILPLVGLLASCGDDDDVDTGLTRAEAEDAVELALLDEDDLGDGWGDLDDAGVVDECTSATVLRSLDDAELAASQVRSFQRRSDDPFGSTRVSVRTRAYDDADAIDDVLAMFGDEAFVDCLDDFDALVSADDSDLVVEAGDAEIDESYLALDGVRSSHLSIPCPADAPGFTFDAELDVVVVARGQLASVLQTVELRGTVDGEEVARWSALLADRQRLAQSDT
jgi:hypothetical protein